MKTCVVTGGAGFIGSHLVDALLEKGHRVVVLDNLSTGNRKNLNPGAKFIRLDVRSSRVREVFRKERPEAVFHYAAQIDVRKSVDDPKKDASINILGSLNLLESCRMYGVQKIVFASTGGALYGEADILPTSEKYPAQPISPYAIAKLSVEHYLYYYSAVHHIPYVALRFANVYGPRQNVRGEAGVVAIFSDAMLSGKKPVIYGNGKQTRDYVFVRDVVEASMLALQKKKIGIFNIGTGKETSVSQIFQMLKTLTHSKAKKLYGSAREGEQQRSCLDYSLAKKVLGWSPVYTLQEGLRKTVEWFEAHG